MKKGGLPKEDVPGLPSRKAPYVVIFTDLDGTLLDHDTYKWEEAKPALEVCRGLDVPVVMVSSKTRAEMEILRDALGLSWPFVSENGGGIFFPKENTPNPPKEAVLSENLWKWALGPPYKTLTKALCEIRAELGWDLRGFSEMIPEEIAERTGLNPEASRLASLREFDEPFVLQEAGGKDPSLLIRPAEARGLSVSLGGRFFHLHGKGDKADAVEKLIAWYTIAHPRLMTVGLGDSPNDFAMLKRTSHPVLVRSDRDFPGIEQEIPGLIITAETGPRGWNTVVSDILLKWKGGFS